MVAGMPCWVKNHQYREICVESNNRKSKRARIADYKKAFFKELDPRGQEDRIAEKGFNGFSHYNTCAQVYPCAPGNEDPGSQSSSGHRMGEAPQLVSIEQKAISVLSQKEVQEAQKEQRFQSILLQLLDICESQECGFLNHIFSSTKAVLYSEVIL